MTITILAAGSRGDVQPYVALGVALRQAGARVRLATFGAFATLVEGAGLEFFQLPGDIMGVAASADVKHALEADNPLKVLLSFNQLKTLAAGLNAGFFAACADATAVVYHPGASIGDSIARHLGVPGILAAPFPMVRTADYPALVFYDGPRLGRAYNRLTHRAFEEIMWVASHDTVKAFWRKTAGRVPAGFGNPFGRSPTPNTPTLIGCSRHVFAQPADWPADVHQTGYWFLDEPDWTPPPGLNAFLEAGPAPVYVGFGSIGSPAQAAATTRLVITALQQSGHRGLLATGWSGLSAEIPLPPEIYRLDSAPHGWLFPRVAAVVHHGGAGTTAAGLRAGVPSVLIPHGNDQFAWGRRVHELGVGPRPLPRKRLTLEALADALTAVRSPDMRAAAADLGRRIRTEDGAGTAARLILNTLAKT